MMRGGIYDQLGGGFSRYTVDSLWHVPHFEKMLYDNAQLVSLYSHAFKITGNKEYERVIRETLAFVEKEMMSPEGTFYSSINADSEGEEGKYYKWESSEYYNVYDGVLNYKKPVPPQARQTLLEIRNKRVHPSVDEKIITSWNAMMVVGFLDAYMATGDQHYLDVALKAINNFDFKNIIHVKGVNGFLDDYAWLAKAYSQLYQCTFDVKWMEKAMTTGTVALAQFGEEAGGLYRYSDSTLVEYFDSVIPSSNSVFAEVLFLCGEVYDDRRCSEAARHLIETAISPIDVEGVHIANWARLAEIYNYSPCQIAIVGPDALAFAKELQQHPLPPSIFLGSSEENLPLLVNKLVKNKTMIYVCKNRTCKLPVDDPKKALEQLRR
jgi:uncharacterized protein YyaL (SSP411 family)